MFTPKQLCRTDKPYQQNDLQFIIIIIIIKFRLIEFTSDDRSFYYQNKTSIGF